MITDKKICHFLLIYGKEQIIIFSSWQFQPPPVYPVPICSSWTWTHGNWVYWWWL